MKFNHVAGVFDLLEKTSSRIDMTKILAQLFSEATGDEVNILCNLSLGMLRPPYQGTQFNFAEKNLIVVVSELLSISTQEIVKESKKLGDLGSVVMLYNWKKADDLTLKEIYRQLCVLEEMSGKGSQQEKIEKTVSLLKKVSPLEAKFIIRIILGILRLGFSDMTLVDALSWMEAGNKSLRDRIEHAYNICVDIGLIGKTLKNEGMSGLDKMQITVGIPIRPAAAERMPTAKAVFEKLGACVAQPKLDGFRLQIHLDKTKKEPRTEFFSRNLIDMSAMFPDLVEQLSHLDVESLICEGEAISFDPHTGVFLPFQETVKRKRKHGIEQAVSEFPLQVFIFDLLYLNGVEYLNKTHSQRRKILADLLKNFKSKTIKIIPEEEINSVKDLERYFFESIEAGLEGLVVKKPDAVYQPGKRNFNWIKLKRHEEGELEDTLDCVILGYYAGSGKRADFGIGAFLVGVYNEKHDNYQTIAKVGSGLTDEGWKELKKKCDAVAEKIMPKNIECAKELYPDVWTFPELVVTIRADEITTSPLHTAGKTKDHLGFALRFPRFITYRIDKSAKETTTVQEIKRLYEDQYKIQKK